jgi:hypothetical protein
VIAGALIAKCAVDHYKVGRRPGWGNLTGRRDAHEQLAAASKELFCDEDGKRRTNNSTDNSDLMATQIERVEFCVVTGPTRKGLCLSSLSQLTHQVTIRVQNADRRHIHGIEALLPSCFP